MEIVDSSITSAVVDSQNIPNSIKQCLIATEPNSRSCTGNGECLVMNTDGCKGNTQLSRNEVEAPIQSMGTAAADFVKSGNISLQTEQKPGSESKIKRGTDQFQITANEVNDPSASQTENCVKTMGVKEAVPMGISSENSLSQSVRVPIKKSNGSLGLLAQYVSSSSDEDEEDDEENGEDDDDGTDVGHESSADKRNLSVQAKDIFDKAISKGVYRVAYSGEDSDKTDSDDDDSDVECVGEVVPSTIDITNEDELKAFMDACDDISGTPKGPLKVKGEFGLDDLPPIADLTITVSESDCIQLGTISGVVETLVLVESLANFAAVDIDTVLFLDKGNRTLGQVFDVMGNVASPIYCVRFNKAQDIIDKKITIGEIVYVAPKTEHTNFIVLSELMNQKGTDASWEDDIEPPTGYDEFSDDEEERIARRNRNQSQRNRNRMSCEGDGGLLPNKVTVKQEPVASRPRRGMNRNMNHRNHRNHDNSRANPFYKDNRGYANMPTNYTNLQQNRQPMQYDHSWHTVGMMPTPLPSSSQAALQMPIPQGYYPNPYAIGAGPMNYGYFNLQAFPPLPPPLYMQPPTSSNLQRNSHSNNQTPHNWSGPYKDNQ